MLTSRGIDSSGTIGACCAEVIPRVVAAVGIYRANCVLACRIGGTAGTILSRVAVEPARERELRASSAVFTGRFKAGIFELTVVSAEVIGALAAVSGQFVNTGTFTANAFLGALIDIHVTKIALGSCDAVTGELVETVDTNTVVLAGVFFRAVVDVIAARIAFPAFRAPAFEAAVCVHAETFVLAWIEVTSTLVDIGGAYLVFPAGVARALG